MSVCHHTDFGVRRAVCTEPGHARRTFRKGGVESAAEETGIMLFDLYISTRAVVDGDYPTTTLCDIKKGIAKSCCVGTEFATRPAGPRVSF